MKLSYFIFFIISYLLFLSPNISFAQSSSSSLAPVHCPDGIHLDGTPCADCYVKCLDGKINDCNERCPAKLSQASSSRRACGAKCCKTRTSSSTKP